MNLSEPNQALRRSVGVSTALISKLGTDYYWGRCNRPRLIGPIF